MVALVCLLLITGFCWGIFLSKKTGFLNMPGTEHWTLGGFVSSQNFQVQDVDSKKFQKILSADQVTDVPANFVADPFVIYAQNQWHLLFEVLNARRGLGEIGWATSKDGLKWDYQKIVLSEPFHLAFPHVFEWEGNYYMIPDANDSRTIRLYQAVEFPTQWKFVKTLAEGRRYVDPCPFFHDNRWWMFTGESTNKHLYLFTADHLMGPWKEHPKSPLIQNDSSKARPAGPVWKHQGKLYRMAQNDNPYYGKAARCFKIKVLNSNDYQEVEIAQTPFLNGSSQGWNALGMHHFQCCSVQDLSMTVMVSDGLQHQTRFQRQLRWGRMWLHSLLQTVQPGADSSGESEGS